MSVQVPLRLWFWLRWSSRFRDLCKRQVLGSQVKKQPALLLTGSWIFYLVFSEGAFRENQSQERARAL
jgi:hypothetical protein